MLRRGAKRKAAEVDTVDTVQSEFAAGLPAHAQGTCQVAGMGEESGGNARHEATIPDRRDVGKSARNASRPAFK
jgi:hypothetical protein